MHRRPIRRALAAAVIVLTAFVADRMDWTEWLDQRLADGRAAFVTYAPTTGITLVDIDAASLAEIGVWPWPRELHGELLREAEVLGARMVAFDVDFSTSSTPQGDAAFAGALATSLPETLLAAFVQESAVGTGKLAVSLPSKTFLDVSWPAGVNVPLDGDGRVRRFSSKVETGMETLSSMPTLLAGREPEGETFGINFSIDAGAISRISYVDLLKGRADPALVADRALIVGASAVELRDLFRVPLHGVISGSTVIALATETLFQGRAITPLTVPAWAYGLLLLASFAASAFWRGRRLLVTVAAAVGAVEFVALWLHHSFNLSVSTSGLHFAFAGLAGLAVLREFDLRKFLLKVSTTDANNSRLMLERVVEDGFDGIVILDEHDVVVRSNEAARLLPLRDGTHGTPRCLAEFPSEVQRAVERSRSYEAGAAGNIQDVEVETRDGDRTLEYTVTPLHLTAVHGRMETGFRSHTCLTFRDVTEARHAHERMRFLALHDSLTGLGNRRALETILEAMAAAEDPFVLLIFDLDRFKSVNDSLGHGIGDRVLVETARRARLELGAEAFVSRIGGDEFAAVVRLRATDAPEMIAQALAQAIDEPFSIAGHRISIGTSVGIALHRTVGILPSHLMQQADMALYRAKHSAGSLRVALFHPAMEEKRLARLDIENDLVLALENDQFEVVYQPQVNLEDGTLVGAEALLRWFHPTKGFVPPSVFIPVAEEMGLIHRLGEWVLTQACREAALWPEPIRVAVNVSSTQFEAGDLVAVVDRALGEAGLPAARLELEITESAFVRESIGLSQTFDRLRAYGIGFALDDFGTGYSSLGYLHRFPISKIKIDKSFVDGLPFDGHSMAIVRSIMALGSGLGLRIIAEGIETAEQAECLRTLGCRDGQGYLYSRPVSSSAMQTLFRPPADERMTSVAVRAAPVPRPWKPARLNSPACSQVSLT